MKSPYFYRKGIQLYQKLSGRRLLSVFDQLVKTQWLNREQLLSIQNQKLHALLDYAGRNVPYYRNLFQKTGFPPDNSSDSQEFLRQLPIIDKNQIRTHFDHFFTTEPRRRKSIRIRSTSGSSGHPLKFGEDLNYRDHVTADILRHLTWSGWRLGDPHGYFWGYGRSLNRKAMIREALMDIALNRFVISSQVISDTVMSELTRKVRQYSPRVLFSYANSLYVFALYLQKNKIRFQNPIIPYVSGGTLYSNQRKTIEQAMGQRVFNRYGALEAGGLACECEEHSGMHISVENCLIEIIKNGTPVEPGETGQVIVTNLNNYGFPLIRYRLEDFAAMSLTKKCKCGRELPLLEKIIGRKSDLFRAKDGSMLIGDFGCRPFETPGILQFQIIQKSLDLILVRLVTDETFQKHRLDIISHMVQKSMGPDVKVEFEFLESIPPEQSGKFRYIRSEID